MSGLRLPFIVGIRIFCTEERSQTQNREKALLLLRTRLYELELEKQQSEIAAKRRSQASSWMLSTCFCIVFVPNCSFGVYSNSTSYRSHCLVSVCGLPRNQHMHYKVEVLELFGDLN